MKQPAIVATPTGVRALRAELAEECTLVAARDPEAALAELESFHREGVPVLLVELDAAAGAREETLGRAAALAPDAAFAFAREPEPDASPAGVAARAGLLGLAALALGRFRLEHRARENERQLELVSSAGVAMAGSFDIREILERTRSAARDVLQGASVHLYYAGYPAINARPRWHPETESETAPDRLPEPLRARVEERVAGGTAWDASVALPALPLSHRGSCLGALVLAPPSRSGLRPLPAGRRRLLEILALQAATALGNIHSAQERIQFERLSAVGRMIGSIVHDFRSPLTALRGYAGMLHRLDLRESERSEFTGALLDECDRLDHMVEELLHFSRGRTPALDRRPTRLGPYLEGIAARARRHFGSTGIEVSLDVACDEEVRIDRRHFERAIWNAVANGCQAMSSKGGRLAIRASRLGDGIAIDIDDEGDGIPAEIRHRIFEPFFSYGKSEGIGLGMATAKRMVEEHGGEIAISSRPGQGTRVRFLLPLAPEESAPEMALPARTAKG